MTCKIRQDVKDLVEELEDGKKDWLKEFEPIMNHVTDKLNAILNEKNNEEVPIETVQKM